jgi:hypothetical protein
VLGVGFTVYGLGLRVLVRLGVGKVRVRVRGSGSGLGSGLGLGLGLGLGYNPSPSTYKNGSSVKSGVPARKVSSNPNPHLNPLTIILNLT